MIDASRNPSRGDKYKDKRRSVTVVINKFPGLSASLTTLAISLFPGASTEYTAAEQDHREKSTPANMAVDLTKLGPEELAAMMEGPALAPPPGQVSNFVDPPNQNRLAIGAMTACTAVVAICFAIRVYAKLVVMRKAQTQEYLIVTALVGSHPIIRALTLSAKR